MNLKTKCLTACFIASLAQCLIGPVAFAKCANSASELTTSVYFSGGILTDSHDTDVAVARLCEDYQEYLGNARNAQFAFADENYNFFGAYNPTQGVASDIAQVLKQKAAELGIPDQDLNATQIYNWIAGNLTAEEVRRLLVLSGLFEAWDLRLFLITDSLLKLLSERLAQEMSIAMADQRVVEAIHEAAYRKDLDANRRVIVIAHSQGNLFANKVVSNIRTSSPTFAQSIGVIGVATPASQSSVLGFYVTAVDDVIINLLRNLVFDVAPGNLNNRPLGQTDFRDEYRHYFDKSYFEAGLPSRDRIGAEIVRLAASLKYPDQLEADTKPRWLSFIQGDPGVPGDGVTVSLTPSGVIFTLSDPFPLSKATDGITISFYPGGVPSNSLSLFLGTKPDNECEGGLGRRWPRAEVPAINGVSGAAWYVPQQDLEDLREAISGSIGCNGQILTMNDVFITRVYIGLNTLDAVAIGLGRDAFPTEP